MEEQHQEYDFLKCAENPKIKAITLGEPIYFSDKIIKTNKKGKKQERKIILTNKAVYNVKGKELRRRFPLVCIKGITVSKNKDEFVVHCEEAEYDYYYTSSKKRTIIDIIAKYYYIEKKRELELHLIDAKTLDSFVTSKSEKKKDVSCSRMPTTGKISVSEYVYGIKSQVMIDKVGSKKTEKGFEEDKLTLNDFEVIKTIGRGSCGKVLLAKHKKSNEIFAIKSIRKDQIISESTKNNILLEKQVLSKENCPFLLTLVSFFQNDDRIYFVLPYIPGGDLYNRLKIKGTLDEETVRIYSAQIAIAIETLHSSNIVYRDIKPENILIDKDGYLKLCDFGSCIKLGPDDKDFSFAGSPEYASPEMVSGEGHNKMTDWWSFGILLYELLYGKTPFYNVKEARMFELIKMEEVKFPKKPRVSDEVKELIKSLLIKDPENRLSKEGLSKIKLEPFFGNLNFDLIKERKLKINFKPDVSEKANPKNFEEEFLNMPTAESPVGEWVHNYTEQFSDFVKDV